jgi:hypothetical protein
LIKTKSELSGKSTVTQRLFNDESTTLYNERAEARKSRIQNTKNIGTGVPIKSTTTNMNFENVVKRILMTPIACLRPNKSERGAWSLRS